MMDIAVIGAGRIGRIHAGNVLTQPGVRLKFVVDAHAPSAQTLADLHDATVADVDGVLGDPSVHAVLIASSTDTHADLIERAARAGKHIFCEKPVDLSLSRARECASVVSQAGVTCMIGFQRRFDPTFATAHARLVSGEIGEAEMLVVTSRDPGAPPVAYLERSGGIFRDMLIHDFDICRWILGDEAHTVHATGSCLSDPAIEKAGDIDSTAVTIRTRAGRLCIINTARRAAYGYDQRFEVLGSRGMIQAGNVRPTEVTAYSGQSVSTDLPEAFFLERYRAAYAAEIAHFAGALAGSSPVRTTIEDGIKALELADAAARSFASGAVITLGE